MKIPRTLGRILYTLMWPFLYVYLQIGERARLLIVAEDEMLLVRGVLGNEAWGLPGGGLRRGEDPLRGVIREVREEIGIEVTRESVRRFGKERVTNHGLSYKCHFFAVELDQKPELTLQKFEIAEAQWVTRQQATRLALRSDVTHAMQLWDAR